MKHNTILKQELVLLNNSTKFRVPTLEQFESWVALVSTELGKQFQLSIEIVDSKTSRQLNKTYRKKDKPTNVLSFPLELPDFIEEKLIGDLAICAEIVEREAKQQNKEIINHWAHLTLHGILHLLNFDHIIEREAEIMENLEIKLLAQINIENPYAN